ncbi:MAG: cupredoxin domain-containing protein [Xanthobacteraceae bacterium]
MSANRNAGRRYGGPAVLLTLITALVAVNMMLGAAIVHAQSVGNAPTPAAAKAATVTIDNFSFSPETLTIKLGTKVTFVNHDDIPHTVVAVDKTFKSKALDTDDSFEFTFTTAGDIDYFCSLHPHMKAKIIVAP